MKKLIALMLALIMVVSLVACGSGGSKAESKQDSGETAEKAAEETAPEEEAPEEEAPEGEAPEAEAPEEEAPEGDAAEGGLKIGACVWDLTGEYFSDTVKGYEKWIEQHPGNELTVVDGQSDARRQIEALENFITAGMDCILLNSVDEQATSDVVKRAMEAGIVVDQYPDADYVTVGLCNDDYNFGYLQGVEAAKWINEHLDGEATIMFLWIPSSQPMVERYEGQKAALLDNCDEDKLTLLEPQSGNTPLESSSAAENILVAHPETKVCLAVADEQANAVAEVLKSRGEDTSDWFISGVNGDGEALNKIKDGSYGYRCTIAYSMRTPDIAYDLIDNIARAARGEKYAAKYYQDVIPVTEENIDEYNAMETTFEDRFDTYYEYYMNKLEEK